jgi:hypothetical protein
MPVWLPLIKVVLPYVGPIVEAAIPALTRKKSEKADPLLAQQITELQEAVKANGESLKSLARGMEESARANDLAMKQMRWIAVSSMTIALVALIVAVAAWVR